MVSEEQARFSFTVNKRLEKWRRKLFLQLRYLSLSLLTTSPRNHRRKSSPQCRHSTMTRHPKMGPSLQVLLRRFHLSLRWTSVAVFSRPLLTSSSPNLASSSANSRVVSPGRRRLMAATSSMQTLRSSNIFYDSCVGPSAVLCSGPRIEASITTCTDVFKTRLSTSKWMHCTSGSRTRSTSRPSASACIR